MAADIRSLVEQAVRLQQAGRAGEAEAVHRRILTLDGRAAVSLQFLSARAFERGAFAEAAELLRRYLKLDPTSANAYQALGLALEQQRRSGEAVEVFGQAVQLEPQNPMHLMCLGRALETDGDPERATAAYWLAMRLDANILRAHLAPGAQPVVAERARAAHACLEAHVAAMHTDAVAAARRQWPDADLDRVDRAVWRKTHLGRIAFADQRQQPLGFYLPDLPAQPWFERDAFDWVAGLEAHWRALRDEVVAALDADADTAPYIHPHLGREATWRRLAGSKDWAALHFYNSGIRNEAAFRRLPKTAAVLDGLPHFRVDGAPIEAFLSVLKPRTRIPPHFGTSNARLTVHLPLVVPDGCGLAVGGEARTVAPGHCLLFDDSFRHEAWNDSDTARIVLIFEVWHPALSEAERAAIAESYAAQNRWGRRCAELLPMLAAGASAQAGPAGKLAEADRLHRAGRFDEAAALHREVLQDDAAGTRSHQYLASWAMHRRDWTTAAAHLRRFLDIVPDAVEAWMTLGSVEEAAGRPEAALAAYRRAIDADPKAMQAYLYLGAVLETLGRAEEAAQVYTLGIDVDEQIRLLHRRADMPAETRQRAARADALVRRTYTRLHLDTVDRLARARPDTDLARVREAVWPMIDERPVQFARDNQRPHSFYMPRLAPVEVYDRSALPWTAALEAHADAIRAEVLAGLNPNRDTTPYVHPDLPMTEDWAALKGSTDWGSLHLFQNGRANRAVCERFPKTLAAFDQVPVVRVDGVPLELFFSVLKPHTRIPPHYGLSNCRLTTHLPLVVPADCGIRVGAHTHRWVEGAVFAFDDSFEHEAWNDSDSVRIVLIFEVWHPDLTDAECRAIEASFAARMAWNAARRLPDVSTGATAR